ncbi:hypothetical protein GCM10010307_24880 [Streptomyces vastus]|uniref:Uncharacterized protein n=1 Tax=Streptomyces vastus TaxID=285451 RepID=A0ABN3QQD2_9ACTN
MIPGPVPTGSEYIAPMADVARKVEQGMTRRQVKRLLGKPEKTIKDKESRGLYSGGAVSLEGLRLLGRRQRRVPIWMYVDTPQAGLRTYVRFRQGRVIEVETVSPRAD